MANKTINIPESLYQQLKSRVDKKGEFSSVEEYIVYILQQVAEKLEKPSEQQSTYSKQDEEKVKERLRNLGYLS